MIVNVVNNSSNELPKYETTGAAGMDLRADISKVQEKYTYNCVIKYDTDGNIQMVTICPGGRALIPTGLHMAVPEGYMLGIFARSGLGLKKGVTMANSVGVIDADYRGDIGLIVQNNGFESFDIHQGDRIGQGIFIKIEQVEFNLVDILDTTARGEGGFNSTGVK